MALIDLLAIFFIAGMLSDDGQIVTSHEIPESELIEVKMEINSNTHIWSKTEKGNWFKVLGISKQNEMLIVEYVGNGGNPLLAYAKESDFRPKPAKTTLSEEAVFMKNLIDPDKEKAVAKIAEFNGLVGRQPRDLLCE